MKRKIIISFFIVVLLLSTILINFVKAETKPFEKFTGMYIKNSEIKPGEKVYVDLYVNHDSSTKIRASGVINNDFNRYITVEIKEIGSKPYFVLPSNVTYGDTFKITVIEVSDSSGNMAYATQSGGINYTNCLGKNIVKVVGNNDEIALNNIALKGSTNYNKDVDKIYFDVQTTGQIEYASINLKNTENPVDNVIVYIQDLKENPYVDLKKASSSINAGTYYISDVFLWGTKNESLQYSKSSTGNGVLPLNFDVKITFEEQNAMQESNNIGTISMNACKVMSTVAKQNEKVNVSLSADKTLDEVMLSFVDTKNQEKMMVVFLKDLNSKSPYFIVPYNTELGTYELNYAILKDIDGNKIHYRKGKEGNEVKHFDFDSIITIEENNSNDTKLLYLENDKITMDTIKDIYEMDEDITIEINANNKSIIESALFEAVKGSNKILRLKYNDIEWIFNGKDIVNTKSIDLSTNIYKSAKDEETTIDSMLSSTGIILGFAENGELPGKCLIRVHVTEDIINVLKKENVNVYYYNPEANNFNKVKMDTILTNDYYYEFYINHNSKYVLTNNEIDPIYVSSITSDLELNGGIIGTNQASVNKQANSFSENKTLLIQIVIINICIIILVLIRKGIILSKKKSKKNNK